MVYPLQTVSPPAPRVSITAKTVCPRQRRLTSVNWSAFAGEISRHGGEGGGGATTTFGGGGFGAGGGGGGSTILGFSSAGGCSSWSGRQRTSAVTKLWLMSIMVRVAP